MDFFAKIEDEMMYIVDNNKILVYTLNIVVIFLAFELLPFSEESILFFTFLLFVYTLFVFLRGALWTLLDSEVNALKTYFERQGRSKYVFLSLFECLFKNLNRIKSVFGLVNFVPLASTTQGPVFLIADIHNFVARVQQNYVYLSILMFLEYPAREIDPLGFSKTLMDQLNKPVSNEEMQRGLSKSQNLEPLTFKPMILINKRIITALITQWLGDFFMIQFQYSSAKLVFSLLKTNFAEEYFILRFEEQRSE